METQEELVQLTFSKRELAILYSFLKEDSYIYGAVHSDLANIKHELTMTSLSPERRSVLEEDLSEYEHMCQVLSKIILTYEQNK